MSAAGDDARTPVPPRPARPLRRGAQLITYPDSLGGDLRALRRWLDGPLAGLFGGVHVLPPFPSSGDRGFAPLTYERIEPRFGTWDDIAAIAADHDVVLDVMVNHISRRSPQFADVERRGRASPYIDLFLTLDKVWPRGDPPIADVAAIRARRVSGPFSTVTVAETGEPLRVWTTFGREDPSEQVDLDLRSDAARALVRGWFERFAAAGVRMVRLDAVGYLAKRAGSDCFMVEPEIWAFMDRLAADAADAGLLALPEVHDRYATQTAIAARGLWTYDFVLPGLVLDAFASGSAEHVVEHLARMSPRVITMLDCHDGIPMHPDLEGILTNERMRELARLVEERGGNVSRVFTGDGRPIDVDVHQLNITWFAAMGRSDDRHVASRALSLFAPGVPQVYYVGLLAGDNDPAGIVRTGDGRALNRHDFTDDEIGAALERPVVQRVMRLLRLRREHPAFDGMSSARLVAPSRLEVAWTAGAATCRLDVDMSTGAAVVTASTDAGPETTFAA